ncbi:MAG: glutamate-5-semialdehyde dehydrogenase [Oscillospiraceae bacterium]|jgi:glutamate-5-semialdehyde dehydrogenase
MTDLQIKTGTKAREAAAELAVSGETARNAVLMKAADMLESSADSIISENAEDVKNAAAQGRSKAFIDRLTLTPKVIKGIADGMRKVASLPDPLGRILSDSVLPNGLHIVKKSVPIGVIGIIFESRPNVSADSAALCIKSGNASVLRGGSDSIRSNRAIVDIIKKTLHGEGLPEDSVQLMDAGRETARELMTMNGYIDVLIPRGGRNLINAVKEQATVPVIETGAGTCQIYVAGSADAQMAADIICNAKITRPSACNAVECMLIDSSCSERVLPVISKKLFENGVTIRGDKKTVSLVPGAEKASDEDWGKEYGDLIIASKVVDGLEEAVSYISKYGTHHSDAIITEDESEAIRFMNEVDSAAVYWNASTRFTDGGEFGMGAEIGISTQKLHARGPLGLEQLCSEKYLIYGSGQVRK